MEGIREDQERRAEYLLERRRELEEARNADCAPSFKRKGLLERGEGRRYRDVA